MGDVTPINPNQITLSERSVHDLSQDLKWAHLSEHGKSPNFLIVGGNFYRKLKAEMRTAPLLRGQLTNTQVTLINGMVLVKVMRDTIEVGE